MYQARDWIGDALDSVRAQSRSAQEVVVVDDGSTDGGAEVAEGHPARPRVIRQGNRGAAAARNAGIRAARGDVVAFLDADDVWLPTKLERQLAAWERSPATGMVFSHAARFTAGEEGRRVAADPPPTHPTSLRRFLLFNRAPTLTVMLSRDVIEATGPFDESPDLRGAEDYHYWLRVLRRSTAVYVPEVLALYRVRPGSLVGAEWGPNFGAGVRAVAHFLEQHPEESRRLYGLPPTAFLAARCALLLASSFWTPGAGWPDRRVGLAAAADGVRYLAAARRRGRRHGGAG